ncbi:MAG: O-antigen ligase family protein [Chloroflexota bacterium]
MHFFRAILQRLLQIAILAVFFLIPWYLRVYSDWLPTFMSGAYAITLPAYLSIGLWIILGAPGLLKALRDVRRWWIVPTAALVVWARLSVTWSLYPASTLEVSQVFVTVGLFTLVMVCTGPSIRQIAIVLAMGIIFQGVISVTQTASNHLLGIEVLGEHAATPDNLGLSVIAAGNERLLRPYGLTNHPNMLGGYFAVALLSLYGWLYSKLDRWRQAVRLSIGVFGLWCLCLSFSRGAWGAFVIGIIAILITWLRAGTERPARQRLAWVAVSGLCVVGLFGLTYHDFILTRTGISDEPSEYRSVSDRRMYTGISLQAIYEYPVLGIGMGSFPWFSDAVLLAGPYGKYIRGDNVHNLPLLVFSELGIIGFAIWLLAWCIGFGIVWHRVRDPFAIGLAAGVLVLLAAGMLDHYAYSLLHFALLLWGGMGVVLGNAMKSQPPSANELSVTTPQ